MSDTIVNYGVTYPSLDATIEREQATGRALPFVHSLLLYQDLNEPAQGHGEYSDARLKALSPGNAFLGLSR